MGVLGIHPVAAQALNQGLETEMAANVRVAFGLRAHSGWAVLVAIGGAPGKLEVVDRRRIELVVDGDAEWAGQPYHAAVGLAPEQARSVVADGIDEARSAALCELRAAVERVHAAGRLVAACAVLKPAPMPAWSVDEILAVHLRMHQAEGHLYPDALMHAAGVCGLPLCQIAAKQLAERARTVLGRAGVDATMRLGKALGPPWGADQKSAALAALIALRESSASRASGPGG
jgi:hypothetical protein